MTTTVRTALGHLGSFRDFPARLQHGAQTYFLIRQPSSFLLLSAICPHQGGTVFDEGTRFQCPTHGWRFDRDTGQCLNAPGRALTTIPVTVEDGVLYADLPREPATQATASRRRVTKPGLSLQLHGHACLEITYRGFRLLTDPWLDGPAFLGSWAPYPPLAVRPSELKPDAILITHEHSDHFHEPTLRHFDRATPILIPDFPNQRLPKRLAALGFTNVTALRFGEARTLADHWNLTAFEPQSYWNDALVLIDVDGFRLLNVNDAGINVRIARMVAPVDILAIQFSGGASGYPWTWAHFTDEQKAAISAQNCRGKLHQIREAAAIYEAGAVLPFASHFTLWAPPHRRYVDLMSRNTPMDVTQAMTDAPADVIDLVPGDAWDGAEGVLHRGTGGAHDLYASERMQAYMERAVDAATFAAHHPSDESLSESELTRYLLGLNDVAEIVSCEDLTVCVRGERAAPDAPPLEVAFEVQGGVLHMLDEAPLPRPNLRMSLPLAILTEIVRHGLSWDEAFIGYWCRFDRYPDVYHAGFWRLLQAPYYRKAPAPEPRPVGTAIGLHSTMAEVVEALGPVADRVLRRYGLYCAGCQHSTTDSIRMAARQHGIDVGAADRLVRELNRAGAPT